MFNKCVLVVCLALASACGASSGQSKAVQDAVTAVAEAFASKADECGLEVPSGARFECDGSVHDAKGLRACAESISALTCDDIASSDSASDTPECAPFSKACGVQ